MSLLRPCNHLEKFGVRLLFADKHGYDVKVKEHTRLDGAVIASTADKEKNRLDTGTLGWTDIHNQADYSATHSGGSFSTGGPVGKDLLTNMAGGMLSGANNGGHAEGTTKAAVSEGMLIIRDADKQQQDVAQLNHDTGHANDGSISPIFNKEKEQNRLKQAQLIGEIGGQAMDVIRTQGDIAGLKAQKDPAALAQAREQLEMSEKPASDADVMRRAYDNAMKQYGTGSDLQKAAQAVTGALTALAGNNLAGALASGASPYLATEIKRMTTNPLTGEVDVAANAMAHAVLGAVTAQLSNQSAVAGGLGAGGGELAARVIADKLFHADTPEKIARLSESEKQQVSALSQLASGLAGGLATSDTAGAVTGGQAGKNAVENNYLSQTQQAQKDKEIAECLSVSCKAGAQAKWTAIDLGQDGSFAAGMVAGVPAGLYDTIDGIVKTASSPVETYQALKALFNSGDVLGNVSDAVRQSYIDRIDRMETEYQKAGASGSFNAGVEGGKLVTDIAGLLAGGAGVAKGGAILTEKVVAKTTGMVETALKSSVVNKILEADRTGSGLKPDPTHRGASYPSRDQLMDGKVFTIKGGDGIERKLLQAEGSFNDKNGIFEYVYDNKGKVTHQRFIESGIINGTPNQRPPKVN